MQDSTYSLRAYDPTFKDRACFKNNVNKSLFTDEAYDYMVLPLRHHIFRIYTFYKRAPKLTRRRTYLNNKHNLRHAKRKQG